MSKKKLLGEMEICEGAIINVGGALFVIDGVSVSTEYLSYGCSSDWRDSTITIKCHGWMGNKKRSDGYAM